MAASERHATAALLRAHLSAAASFRHATRRCPVCLRLLLLALDRTPEPPQTKIVSTGPSAAAPAAALSSSPRTASGARTRPVTPSSRPSALRAAPRAVISAPALRGRDESPLPG
ncbi:hypothetical protein C3486_16720 [Streptomyces sp. Ru73]|uniref:DUF6274 family protein n=1 Tax=Streptomyces sp. Ru73 TaxID=2080748 RepID=UPI000CDD945C|nr:DUF6274 family protein [Streptomyces sp. Ru73]POX39760.1 hypothetical protein C3486_16720 [Streptomyces sp. Ru73]